MRRKGLVISFIIILLIVVQAVWAGFLYWRTGELYILLCSLAMILITILLFFLYRWLTKKEVEGLLTQVSDLISHITEMRELPKEQYNDDLMLSKLEHQIIKLTGILQNQNRIIGEEREAIQSMVSEISHQLKTPVANIKLYHELLQEQNVSKMEQEEFGEALLLSVERLQFLTEGLIKMSRLESGIIQIRKNKEDLNDTIRKAIAQAEPRAEAKRIHIEYKETCSRVFHDKNWLGEAIYNLLDNAIKYSPEATEIMVRLTVNEMFACLQVRDHGVGIPEKEQGKIFRRFYRGKMTDNQDGIGLGLYLTRKIVMAHDGFIKVKSDDKGTCFNIFLPVS